MAIFEMTYEAKCKHCKHFKVRYPLNKDGSTSKRKEHYCESPKGRTWNLTLKDKACKNIEL